MRTIPMILVNGIQRMAEQPDPKTTIAVQISGDTATVYEKGDVVPQIDYKHAPPDDSSEEGLRAQLTEEQLASGLFEKIANHAVTEYQKTQPAEEK